jgi:hypothetical protein
MNWLRNNNSLNISKFIVILYKIYISLQIFNSGSSINSFIVSENISLGMGSVVCQIYLLN